MARPKDRPAQTPMIRGTGKGGRNYGGGGKLQKRKTKKKSK